MFGQTVTDALNTPAANFAALIAGAVWVVWYAKATNSRKRTDPHYRHGVYGERLSYQGCQPGCTCGKGN